MDYLEITAHMRTAIISDDFLPFDGLLFYQQVREDKGPQDVTIPGASLFEQPKGEKMLGTRLPLDRVHGKDWYYKASWAIWGPHVDGKDHWNKRFDFSLAELIDFKGKRGKVENQSGPMKAYHMPVYYRSALWVRWYVVGDKERIEKLLSTLTNIGKKYAQGWGRVARWEVKVIAEDWSILKDGKLMRGVPVGTVEGNYNIAMYGARPSYWDKRNQMPLLMP